MADESKRSAAYVPWATFKTALDQLAQGVPSRLDRSVFPGFAWNVQTQLFAALKFLGLLTGEDQPTIALPDLVSGSDEERKQKLRKVIEGAYSELIAVDLTKATRAHFEEKLGELYGVTGDTRIKAARFFVSAAAYTGIPLSSFIQPQANGTPGGVKRRVARPKSAPKKQAPPAAPTPPPPPDPTKHEGTSRTVNLVSGGTLTISATKDFFALNAGDRKFFNDIVEKLDVYEAESKKAGKVSS